MHIELHCPRCFTTFQPEGVEPAGDVWGRMTEEGPWYALGDGETLEDVIFSALSAGGGVRCPRCGEAVPVTQDDLCEMSQKILANW